MVKTFEIFFSDLTEEAQQQLLGCFKIKEASEMNWDIFPIAQVGVETIEVKK